MFNMKFSSVYSALKELHDSVKHLEHPVRVALITPENRAYGLYKLSELARNHTGMVLKPQSSELVWGNLNLSYIFNITSRLDLSCGVIAGQRLSSVIWVSDGAIDIAALQYSVSRVRNIEPLDSVANIYLCQEWENGYGKVN